MGPVFKTVSGGIEVIDPIERSRQRFLTPNKANPEPVSGDEIPYPIQSASEIYTSSIVMPTDESIYVRDTGGELLAETKPGEPLSLPNRKYILDISSSIKMYCAVDSSLEIEFEKHERKISFADSTKVVIGARSFHTSPAGTIKTTTEPADTMQAISMFGSALKTSSAERSYATLRGHPPIIELGDELCIPDEFELPKTGITIEIPPEIRFVFVCAPLAYYLGAKVVPGTEPLLKTASNYTFRLDGENGFESTVERVLKQTFFLDCIVRTEGEDPGPLYERQVVEPILEFDIEKTYDQPLASRIETYLKEPFETLEPYLPSWPLTTRLEENAECIPFLPFLAQELSVIHTHTGKNDTQSSELDFFPKYEDTPPTIDQIWNTNGIPKTTSRSPLSSFQHRLGQPPQSGPIEIEIVCNDPKMNREFVNAHSEYGDQDRFPLDITLHHNLTKGELEDVLRKNSDFLHYIGHIDGNGFRCSNGRIDASTIDTVGATAFFLNACQSYRQGRQLIELGSQAGIVTLNDVKNREAVEVGSTVARLLSRGFPMYATMDITRTKRTAGQQYHIVGDGKTSVSQPESGSPLLGIVGGKTGERTVKCYSYVTTQSPFGGIHQSYVEGIDSYHLLSGEVGETPITKRQLVEFLESGYFPVLLDGELRWSNDIKTTEL